MDAAIEPLAIEERLNDDSAGTLEVGTATLPARIIDRSFHGVGCLVPAIVTLRPGQRARVVVGEHRRSGTIARVRQIGNQMRVGIRLDDVWSLSNATPLRQAIDLAVVDAAADVADWDLLLLLHPAVTTSATAVATGNERIARECHWELWVDVRPHIARSGAAMRSEIGLRHAAVGCRRRNRTEDPLKFPAPWRDTRKVVLREGDGWRCARCGAHLDIPLDAEPYVVVVQASGEPDYAVILLGRTEIHRCEIDVREETRD